jgi:hypothetical protein
MAQLEQGYPDAVPTAISELEAIGEVDQELSALSMEQLQSPIEITRKATSDGVLIPGEPPPLGKADVLEFATDLLKEEIKTRHGASTSPAQLLQQRRIRHGQALLRQISFKDNSPGVDSGNFRSRPPLPSRSSATWCATSTRRSSSGWHGSLSSPGAEGQRRLGSMREPATSSCFTSRYSSRNRLKHPWLTLLPALASWNSPKPGMAVWPCSAS